MDEEGFKLGIRKGRLTPQTFAVPGWIRFHGLSHPLCFFRMHFPFFERGKKGIEFYILPLWVLFYSFHNRIFSLFGYAMALFDMGLKSGGFSLMTVKKKNANESHL